MVKFRRLIVGTYRTLLTLVRQICLLLVIIRCYLFNAVENIRIYGDIFLYAKMVYQNF